MRLLWRCRNGHSKRWCFRWDKGRSSDGIKILPGLLLSLGSTEEEARRRGDDIHDAGPASYSTAWLSQAIGVDASKLELDAPFPEDVLGALKDSQTFLGQHRFSRVHHHAASQDQATVREYLKQTRYTGSGHAGFVGTPEQLADHIEDWFHAGAIDGFNLQPDRRVDRLDVIVDELVLILRKRGLYRYGYETRTLREHFRASAPAAPCKNRWTQMGCPVLLRGAPKLGAAKKLQASRCRPAPPAAGSAKEGLRDWHPPRLNGQCDRGRMGSANSYDGPHSTNCLRCSLRVNVYFTLNSHFRIWRPNVRDVPLPVMRRVRDQ